jgi:hypothetical protein
MPRRGDRRGMIERLLRGVDGERSSTERFNDGPRGCDRDIVAFYAKERIRKTGRSRDGVTYRDERVHASGRMSGAGENR